MVLIPNIICGNTGIKKLIKEDVMRKRHSFKQRGRRGKTRKIKRYGVSRGGIRM